MSKKAGEVLKHLIHQVYTVTVTLPPSINSSINIPVGFACKAGARLGSGADPELRIWNAEAEKAIKRGKRDF
jgi:hypothetical protein